MSEHDKQTTLGGSTVEESDRTRLEMVRGNLAELTRTIQGFPTDQETVEVETIPPKPLIGTSNETLVTNLATTQTLQTSLPKDSPVHIVELKTHLIVAQGTDDSDAYKELKKAA